MNLYASSKPKDKEYERSLPTQREAAIRFHNILQMFLKLRRADINNFSITASCTLSPPEELVQKHTCWDHCPSLISFSFLFGPHLTAGMASQVAQCVKNLSAMQETQETWVRVGKIPLRRAWQPTLVFLPGEYLGQRSLVGYSPWGCKGSDTTEASEYIHIHARTHSRHGILVPWGGTEPMPSALKMQSLNHDRQGTPLPRFKSWLYQLCDLRQVTGPQSHLWDEDNNIYHRRSTENVMNSCAWKYLGQCLVHRKYPASVSYYYLSFKMKIALWNYRLWE